MAFGCTFYARNDFLKSLLKILRFLWVVGCFCLYQNILLGKNLEAITKAKKSVVTLYVLKSSPPSSKKVFAHPNDNFPSRNPQDTSSISWGSGILVAPFLLLTSYHLVEKAQKIEVAFENGTKTLGRILKTDASHDLAMIQLTSKGKLDLTPLSLDNETPPQEGESVFVIGNMWGLPQSISKGVISCLRRRLPTTSYPLIQIDAPLGPGSSGGALLNTEGNVIGLITAVFNNKDTPLGVGFAIPLQDLKVFLDSIGEAF
ncbi:MAG: S1C family serine protease [Holosporales bacterium]